MIESDGVARSTTKLADVAAAAAVLPQTTALPLSPVGMATTTPSSDQHHSRGRGPHRLTANGPKTPVPVTTTASTTYYGDETGPGHQSNNNSNNNDNNNRLGDPTSTDYVVPWSPPHAIRDGNATAAINRNQPQLSESSATSAAAAAAADTGLKDQVNGGNFADIDEEDDKGSNNDKDNKMRGIGEQASGHQMTKNINDVKHNYNNQSTIIIKTRVDNNEVEVEGDGNGERTPAPLLTTQAPVSSSPATTSTTAAAAASGYQQRWEAAEEEAAADRERDADIDREAAASADEDFIRKISIDDDSPLAKHYIITSSGDIENIPLANQHLVSQFRENFINEIMPLNSVEKAVKVDMPPPTLILDTYPSPAMLLLTTRPGGSGGGIPVASTAPIIVGTDHYPSTIAGGGGGVPSGGIGGFGFGGGAPTLASSSSSYATKIFIPSGLAPSGPANANQQQAQQSKNSEESVQVWNSSGGGGGGGSVANKDSSGAVVQQQATSEANPNNKTPDPVCIVMGKCS